MSTRHSILIVYFAFQLLGAEQSWAGCKPDRIEIVRSSGFGISFGGGSSSVKGDSRLYAGIPVSVNGKRGCWAQKSKLRFKVDADSTSNRGTLDIFPAEGEFENVEGGRIDTYVMTEGRPPNLSVHAVSVACAGSSILSMESFSGATSALQKVTPEAAYRTRIAVGVPARMGIIPGNELPEIFARELRNGKDGAGQGSCETCEPREARAEVHVPSVVLGTVLEAPGVSTTSTFSTTQLAQRLCSEKSRADLARFKVGSYSQSQGADRVTLEYSKWRNRLRVKWQ